LLIGFKNEKKYQKEVIVLIVNLKTPGKKLR